MIFERRVLKSKQRYLKDKTVNSIMLNLFGPLLKTFGGGIFPEKNKETSSLKIENLSIPKELAIPLCQHIGKPSEPTVQVGDKVLKYQKIAEADGDISAAVHATSSGTVKAIEKRQVPSGGFVDSVIIETDGEDAEIERQVPNLEELEPDQIVDLIRDAGIVGLGGATFPTHFKYKGKKETKDIHTLVLNGSECEPYLTSDHRVMIEHSKAIVKGAKVLKDLCGAKRVYIGIEDDKYNAIENLEIASEKYDDIIIKGVKTKYPQGSEKMLIFALTGDRVPCVGLPSCIGYVVNNVATAKAVHDALFFGKPLIDRVVTVSGDGIPAEKRGNYLIRIGTEFEHILNECGVDCNKIKESESKKRQKLIAGGPMMGFAIERLNVPVVKATGGLLLLENFKSKKEHGKCMKCGACVNVCPMHLMPSLIAKYGMKDYTEKAEKLGAALCFECGSCEFSCPQNIPLVQMIKTTKGKVREFACKVK